MRLINPKAKKANKKQWKRNEKKFHDKRRFGPSKPTNVDSKTFDEVQKEIFARDNQDTPNPKREWFEEMRNQGKLRLIMRAALNDPDIQQWLDEGRPKGTCKGFHPPHNSKEEFQTKERERLKDRELIDPREEEYQQKKSEGCKLTHLTKKKMYK